MGRTVRKMYTFSDKPPVSVTPSGAPSFRTGNQIGVTPLLLCCAKTVSELHLFELLGLLLERKQIPQIVVNVRNAEKQRSPWKRRGSLGRILAPGAMIRLCVRNSRTNGASFWRSGAFCDPPCASVGIETTLDIDHNPAYAGVGLR